MRKKLVRIAMLLAAVLLCALCFAACASGNMGGSDNSSDGSAEAPETPGDSSDQSDIVAGDVDRKIVYYVSITLRTEDVAAAGDSLKAKGSDAGGYVESQNLSADEDGTSRIYIVLRIPTEQLDAFLSTVGNNGRITSQNISTTDITTQYVNASARKTALEERKAQLEEILSDTGLSASERITVINEISEVNSQLQSIELQLTEYDSLVGYSTVRLTVLREGNNAAGPIVLTVILVVLFVGLAAAVVVLAVKLSSASRRNKMQK